MRFCTLASGSNGNASLLSCAGQSILIDAGISNRAICTSLAELGVSAEEISAVFITHEHSDHIKGLGVWSKQHPGCVYYAPNRTAQVLCCQFPQLRERIFAFEPGSSFSCEAFEVQTFSTPHDTPESVSYLFAYGAMRMMIATDLGYVTDALQAEMNGLDLLLIEANYDEMKLQYGRYPQMLKRRIAGKNGHLSNDACAASVLRAVQGGTRRILLGHLSEENNTPRLAYETVHRRLVDGGIIPGVDVQLQVAPRGMRGETVMLSQEVVCSRSK